MREATARSPDWDHLFEIAAAQDGLFMTQQAAVAGYSPQLPAHHLGSGRSQWDPEGWSWVTLPAGSDSESD